MLFGLTYEEIIEKIKSKGVSEEEIQTKIKQKLHQLSGLISREGAAQIIANEMGIRIFREVGKLKINEIRPGMRDIEVDGKIVNLFDVRSFKNSTREGKVASLVLADETGRIRVVLWDANHIGLIESKQLKEDAVIKIKNTYCRDNNGFKELHLNSHSEITIAPNGVNISHVADNQLNFGFAYKNIADLKEEDKNVVLRGTVVQIFEPRFYEICDRCRRRAVLDNGVFKCGDHGEVSVKYAPVLNLFLDDGTENIRVVCFREAAANAIGVSEDELINIRNDAGKFEQMKNNVLGKQLEVNGRVTKNEMFNRMEFIANIVGELKPEKLLQEG